MQDRDIKIENVELADVPEDLLNNIVYALEEGKKILETATHGQSFAPFTAIVVGDEVYLESYAPKDTHESLDMSEYADVTFEKAQKKVKKKKGAISYAFCYDGFIETEDGEKDAIVAEGAKPKGETGFAIAMPYVMKGNAKKGKTKYEFNDGKIFLGEAPNFFHK